MSDQQMLASSLYEVGAPIAPLRVAIATSGDTVQPWANHLLAHIARLDLVDLVARIVVPSPPPGESPAALVKIYGWLDRVTHPTRFGHDSVREPIGQLAPSTTTVQATNARDPTVTALDLDVVLCLDHRLEEVCSSAWARLGVWYLDFGEDAALTAWPGRTIVERDPKTVITLKTRRAEADQPAILFRAVGSTHGNLWCSENLHWTYLKAAGVVSRCLRQAAASRPAEIAAAPSLRHDRPGPPDTITMASFLTGALGRGQRYRKLARRYNDQWVLGVRPHRQCGAVPHMGGFTMVEPPATSFYADPFPIRLHGRTWIFFEELTFESGKGHISYMLLDDAGRPERVGRALECDYHLSYPFVFAWQGEIYMIPESAAVERVEVFRAERFPDRWVSAAVLLQGYPMVDATLHQEDGRWYMFVNVSESGGRLDDELFLFVADQPFGPWKPHPCNPIKSDASCARSAGPLFRAEGKLMRPSQDSIGGYGQAIVFSEVLRLSPTDYQDRAVGRIGPEWGANLNGCHHYASDGQFDIIDGRRLNPKPRARKDGVEA